MPNVALIGKEYETKLRSALHSVFTKIPLNAGFGTGPDIAIPSANNPGQNVLVEAKTSTAADFGQKAVTFDGTSWVPQYDGTEPADIVGLFNYLYYTYDFDAKIKASWKLPNSKLTADDLFEIVNNRELSKVLYYEKELHKATGSSNPFQQTQLISGPQIVNSIVSYYNSKGVYYIQVKEKGFYILGSDNYGLNSKLGVSIPLFNPPTASVVIRGKASNSDRTYRPTLTLKCSTVSKSNYSLEDRKFIQQLYDNI